LNDYPKGKSLASRGLYGPSFYSEVSTAALGNLLDPSKPFAPIIINLVSKVAADPSDTRLKELLIEAMSRITAVTIARKTFKTLLGPETFDEKGDNKVPIPGDILNRFETMDFFDFTAIRIIDSANFPQEGSYVDEGVTNLSRLTTINQKKMDGYFPVPPNF
jgi:hypothetical protein